MLRNWFTGIALFSIVIASAVVGRQQLKPHGQWADAALCYRLSVSRWELDNFFNKWEHLLKQAYRPSRLSDAEKVEFVRDYSSNAVEISFLKNNIARARAEGSGSESDIASWQSDLETRSEQRDRNKAQAQQIIGEQVSAVLAGQGLSVRFRIGDNADLVFPPVNFQFDDHPNLLIISSRNKIEMIGSILLMPNITADQTVEIEGEMDRDRYSTLVEGIGGVATYPANLPDSPPFDWVISTVAHEWMHQYFFFRPLGQNYWSSSAMTTINETAADIAGKEIGRAVLERFYGVEPQPVQTPSPSPPPPGAFDFNREMREIRTTVDRMLAEGDVGGAEAYMEERRQYLQDNGYYIRKLNQAYFAFHGAYADSPTSVSPIGGQLRDLREKSPSVGAFIRRVSQVSTPEQLEDLLAG